MNSKNKKILLLVVVAVMVIAVSFLLYLTHDMLPYIGENSSNFKQGKSEQLIVESVDIQNNVLTNYFNSLYDSQISDIKSKYNAGTISPEERDKQLNAVTKNRELTVNTLNKLSSAKKDIFTGNITKQDILIRINSFNDIDLDIKSELNATLNGS